MTNKELQEIIRNVALETAKKYVSEPSHGQFYAFPVNGKGANKGLKIAVYPRNSVLHGIESEKCFNACAISENVIKFTKAQVDKIRQAFGIPMAVYDTDYMDYNSLPKSANGLRATTFEKITVDILNENGFMGGGFRWTGNSTKKQYDGENNEGITIECKGVKGKLTKFIAEEESEE